MKKKLFKNIIIIILAVQVCSIVTFVSILYYSSVNDVKQEVKNETEYLSAGFEEIGITYFDNVSSIGKNRITVIDKDGTVLYDNKTDADDMDNHEERPEVISAMETGSGEAERTSDTLMEKTIYYAKFIDDDFILRVSASRITIWQQFLNLIYPLLGTLLITIMAALLLAYNMSNSIVKPINNIDLENPKSSDEYLELKPLINKISDQNELINQQINELRETVDLKTKEAEYRKEFTANVSHELKTPLTSISGYAELINTGIAKPEDIPVFAKKIFDESLRLRVLVEDIIKLSQMDENSIQLIKEPIDIYSLCEKAVSILKPIADKSNITIELKGNHIYVNGIEKILEEIIYNLCDNALKYNKEGGKITIEVAKASVVPYIKVTDTGIGIAKEDLERIFERFFRVDKSHSKEIGGTGLGLSIVKHGASYHNADIEIESKINVGTAITVRFN